MLPIQLIPYSQYTVAAVIGALLLGYGCFRMGQRGFWGAVVAVDSVDPDSLITPWLVFCWLKKVQSGLRRAHPVLGKLYDLGNIHCPGISGLWEETGGYFTAFGWKPETPWKLSLLTVVCLYSRKTNQFLFGKTSQQRRCPAS